MYRPPSPRRQAWANIGAVALLMICMAGLGAVIYLSTIYP